MALIEVSNKKQDDGEIHENVNLDISIHNETKNATVREGLNDRSMVSIIKIKN